MLAFWEGLIEGALFEICDGAMLATEPFICKPGSLGLLAASGA